MHPVYMRNKSISHNTQTTWILNKQYYHSSDTARRSSNADREQLL